MSQSLLYHAFGVHGGLFDRLEVYPREFDLVPIGAKLLTGTGFPYEMLSLQFKECLLNVARL